MPIVLYYYIRVAWHCTGSWKIEPPRFVYGAKVTAADPDRFSMRTIARWTAKTALFNLENKIGHFRGFCPGAQTLEVS